MTAHRLTIPAAIGIAVLAINAMPFVVAAPPEISSVRDQLKAIVNSGDALDLDKVRTLQELLAREEQRLQEDAVATWIRELGHEEFDAREIAEKNLIQAGVVALPKIVKGTKHNSREVAERCITVLAQIAKTDDEATVAAAQQALADLAGDESPIARRAAQVLAELNKTDADRAAVALKAIGAYVHENKAGEVTSVSVSQGVSDREMRLISALPRVTTVSILGEGVTNAGLRELSRLKHLQNVSLLNTSVTDAGMKMLATFPTLTYLTVGSSQISTAGIAALKDSKTIQMIGFHEYLPDQAGIEVLETMQLRMISLSLKDTTDNDLKSLSKLTKLYSLTIADSPQVTDDGLAHLSQLNLRTLRISDATLTDEGVKHLSKMESLNSLWMTGEKITDGCVEHMKDLKNLRYVSLRKTSVTTEGTTKLKALLPSLRRIY